MDGGYRPLALQTMPSDVDSQVDKGQETRSAIIPYGGGIRSMRFPT